MVSVSWSVTGLCLTPPSSHNSAMEMARVLSSVHAISITSVQRVLDQRVWSMLVHYSQASSQFLCMHVYFFFVITHRSVLSILISNLNNKYSSLTLAPNMPCMLLVSMYKGSCMLLQWFHCEFTYPSIPQILSWKRSLDGNRHLYNC